MPMISRYSAHGLTWIDLESPTKDELDLIGEEFAIPSFVRQEMVESTLRSKVDLYPQFLYLVLHFPVISPGAPKNSDQEVDFIIGKECP
jgi:magnesium transporter